MKTTKFFAIKTTKTSFNQVLIREGFDDGEVIVELFNKDNEKVKYWDNLDIDNDKVKITMEFDNKTSTRHQEDDSSAVEYLLENHGWEIDEKNQKVILNLESEKKLFNKAIKEANIDLFKKNFSNYISSNKAIFKESEDIEYSIKKDGKDIVVSVFKKDDNQNVSKHFKDSQIEIDANFYPKKKANFWDIVTISTKPEENRWKWTIGKTFFLIVAIVFILIIIFWKKIWVWINSLREREQEKKIKEQIEIF